MPISYYSTQRGVLKTHINSACFADLRGDKYDSVLYFAKCDTIISKNCAEAYGNFVKSLFPENIDYEVVKRSEVLHSHLLYDSFKHLIVWNIKTKDLTYTKLLFLGTFCRMVHEFSEIIKLWHEFVVDNPTATNDTLLSRFQEIHVETEERIHKFVYMFSLHGLMCFTPRQKTTNRYSSDSEYPYNPLTVAELNVSFKDANKKSVLSHFNKTTVPASS